MIYVTESVDRDGNYLVRGGGSEARSLGDLAEQLGVAREDLQFMPARLRRMLANKDFNEPAGFERRGAELEDLF